VLVDPNFKLDVRGDIYQKIIPVQMAQEVFECSVVGIRKFINTLMQSYMPQAVILDFCIEMFL
jgi:hypothetical protein